MGRDDLELLEAAKRGERDAFAALIERYQGMVCAVSYSRTGNRALSEDVAQETFVAAWRQLGRLREPGQLRAWLCGIARNLAIKAMRRTARETSLDVAHERPVVGEGANPFDAVAEAEAEQVVTAALARMPATYRDVLVLYYCDGRSVRDVAAALGLSEAATLQRLARGRQHLADGAAELVERSLRAARPRHNLAALVLAALPALAVSRAETAEASSGRSDAQPRPESHAHSPGGSMIKMALIAAVLATAGTTAYVTHHRAGAAAVAAVSVAPAVAQTRAPSPAAPHAQTPTFAPAQPALPARSPSGSVVVPDMLPAVDAATITRLGLDRGPGRGPDNAPVTITMFSETMCPFCAKSIGTLDQLFDEYPGKLRLVVKQFPVHPQAGLSAEAAYAADAQGKFWELYDLMTVNQDPEHHTQDGLVALARQAGLDVAAFRAALERHTFAAAVAADQSAANQLDFQGIPAFVINGKRVLGAQPIAAMREAVEQALAAR